MQVLFAVLAAAALAVVVCLKRRSRRNIDGGKLSDSWLRDQRADKRD
jgi:hypothetical protein